MKRILGLLLVLSLAASPRAFAASFDSLISFGDSLSDTGSGPATPPSFGGRFSNGPVWEEYLASDLGIDPSHTHNYAIGGAETGTMGLGGTPTGLLTQVQTFLSAPVALGAKTLFTVWAGGNDAIALGLSGGDPTTAINTAVANITTAIMELHGEGAQYFVVPNLPDGALFPIAKILGNPSGGTAFSNALNAGLDASLASLVASTHITVFRLDTFGLFNQIVASPGAFGLTDVVDPCRTGSGASTVTCANPDQFLFWDTVHPTTRVHGFIGADAARLVPEPEVAVLVALAFAAALRRARLR
jgi:phospholipase/lecithinase/hemolysin